MDAHELVNNLALSVIGGAYVLLFSLLLLLWNRIEKSKNQLGQKIDKAMGDINRLAEKNKKAVDLHDDRLDVLDRVTSVAADTEFSSKLVSTGHQPQPSTKKLRRLIDRGLHAEGEP